MKVAGIIPVRLDSSRLPEKALLDMGGKPLISRVYENALSFGLDELIVATDSNEIEEAVSTVGAPVIRTEKPHQSGSSRCAEIAGKIDADLIINIQGDEPFLLKEQVALLISCFDERETDIATLCYRLEDQDSLQNPAHVKVVRDSSENALYFSRSPIPYLRDIPESEWLEKHEFYKHIGIYAYRTDVLLQLPATAGSKLEKAEKLEQLAWLEAGYNIKVKETQSGVLSVDTRQDLERARALIKTS